ncbi:hypothetical protein BCR34DRAFT_579817 [Clohesyomyces aquaticus]|uniref:Small secreted protein n=1 Tax=Clohesyomyces aquaticus TaxID=1231657 RepID=A0A1Y1YAN5_9PLEO|nr:hypothetical protein BCR34DRAFT_579817 [Clohesyomyces aquaticus]
MKMSLLLAMLALSRGAVSVVTAFNITAISAANNASRLECWQLAAPPISGRGAVNFALGDFDQAFVGIIPPNTTAGTINNAEQVQYSLIMAGLAHISTPYSGLPAHLNDVWIKGGRYGMLIAADLKEVAAKGHITTFPGQERTIIAQFPYAGNKVPEHCVLHAGPCTDLDLLEL